MFFASSNFIFVSEIINHENLHLFTNHEIPHSHICCDMDPEVDKAVKEKGDPEVDKAVKEKDDPYLDGKW